MSSDRYPNQPKTSREQQECLLVPIALRAIPEVQSAIAAATEGPVDSAVQEAIHRHVTCAIRRLIRTRGGSSRDSHTFTDTEADVAKEVFILLRSRTVPAYDQGQWPLLSHYLRYLVDTVLPGVVEAARSKLRSDDTRRATVYEHDPENPDGPLKKKRPFIPKFAQLPSDFDHPARPETAEERLDRIRRFRECLALFPMTTLEREILDRHYMGEAPVTLTRIAELLGIACQSVYKTHQRLLGRLRKHFVQDSPN